MRDPDVPVIDQVLEELTAAGALARWWPTVYEPETVAFGGPAGIQAAHDLFCAGSRGILDYARQNVPGLGRRELSVLLINALLRAADLDVFERVMSSPGCRGCVPHPSTPTVLESKS